MTKHENFVFDLTTIGYEAHEAVPVYDIWGKTSLGTAAGTLDTKVPSHGVRLFRLGDNQPIDGIGDAWMNDNEKEKRTDNMAGQADVFNLNGQAVGRTDTPGHVVSRNLPKGLYIVGGKKYVN